MSVKGYDSFLVTTSLGGNRKVRRLTPAERWCAVHGVWAIAAESPVRGSLWLADGVPATEQDYAEMAGVSAKTAAATVRKMRELGMLKQGDGVEVIHDWEQHQRSPRATASETREARAERKRAQRDRDKEALSRTGHEDVTRDIGVGHADEVEVEGEVEENSKDKTLVLSRQRSEKAERPEVLDLSNRLAGAMRRNDPKAKTAPDSDRWTEPIRLLIDRDGRSVEEITRVIDWCQADEFWRGNIESPSKLRDKFTQLRMKMNSTNGPAVRAGRESPSDLLRALEVTS